MQNILRICDFCSNFAEDLVNNMFCLKMNKVLRTVILVFCSLSLMSFTVVIDAGHGVEQNDACAVNAAAHHAPCAAVLRGTNHAQHQRQHTECTAHDVRYHVKPFLAACVIGKAAFPKRCSFHKVFIISLSVFEDPIKYIMIFTVCKG